MNRSPYVEWQQKVLGTRIDYDGYPKGYEYQCTDLVKEYIDKVVGFGKVGALGNAGDRPRNKFFNDWEIIPVENGNFMQGDILVRNKGTYGHVAILDRVLGLGNILRVLEQNGSGKNSGNGLGANAIRLHNYDVDFYQIILRCNKIFLNLKQEREYIDNKIKETEDYRRAIRYY